MSIDLKKLRHIVEVARSQGITLAAQNLLITQSALTRSIADAESELGVQLFQRMPRGVRLTDAGREFVKKARRILGDMEDLLEETSHFRDLTSGKLQVGFSPGAFLKFFSPSLSDFIANYQGVRMEMFSGSAENNVPQLMTGELDLVFGTSRQFIRWPELEVQSLKDLYCKILVRKDHPLTKEHKLSVEKMAEFPWVQASSIEPIDSDLARCLNKAGYKQFRPQYLCDDFDLVRDIIRKTDAASPVFSPNPEFSHLKSDFALLDNIIGLPTHSLAVAYAKSRILSPAAEQFIEHVKNYLNQ